MPDFGDGLQTAIVGAVLGFIFFTILGTLPPSLPILAIYAIIGASTLGVIDSMPFWSSSYIAGWILGNVLISKGGITNPTEVLVYFVAGVGVLLARTLRGG